MPLEKAIIKNLDTNEKVTVMFNPEEYTVNKDINYAQTAVPGLNSPILQFVNGNMATLEMELFLDTYEAHGAGGRQVNQAHADVRQQVAKITHLMEINPETHAPPVLRFTWSSLSFTCVLARVNQSYTMFLPNGTPVRARLQVTFNEFNNVELEAKEIKRETADFSRRYVVKQGETLSAIAGRTYGDPTLWRPIARLNEIANPREVAVGAQLLVPQLPFRDPQTGEVFE